VKTYYLTSIVRWRATKVKHGDEVPWVRESVLVVISIEGPSGSPTGGDVLGHAPVLAYPCGDPHRIKVAEDRKKVFPGDPQYLPEVCRAQVRPSPKPSDHGDAG